MSDFAPGFRCSVLDLVVLAAGLLGAAVAVSMRLDLGVFVALPVAQFFLFCNVFRVRRLPELVWAAGFVALLVAVFVVEWLSWRLGAMIAVGLGGLVVVAELRERSYHGAGWRRINPRLREWWDEQLKKGR